VGIRETQMNNLSSVSETALITIKARVAEAERKKPLIKDEVGQVLLSRMEEILPDEQRNRILHRKMPRSLSNYVALRALKLDAYTKEFLQGNPEGLVVSLGAGFDTRFWRLGIAPDRYIEIDLPPVVEAKRRLLGDILGYRMIAESVLEDGWLEEILCLQDGNILFLAEGLFMYLAPSDVRRTFGLISSAVSNSLMVIEVVNARYTKGIWKKMLIKKMERNLGSGAGASFDFGITQAKELESFGANLEVLEEWSYFEDENIHPSILKLFRNWEFLSRTQWIVKVSLD